MNTTTLIQGTTSVLNAGNNGALIVQQTLNGYNSGTWLSSTLDTGLQIGWNQSGGTGEVDFLCNGQGGAGGFYFYITNAGAPSLTKVSTINSVGAYTQISDYRLKSNVVNLNSEIFTVDKLRPVIYDLKDHKNQMGFIAHEVQEIFPELITGLKDGENNQMFNMTGLIPVLVLEIQQLKAHNETLTTQLQTLTTQVQTLVEQIQSLLH